eukprot:s3685_g5.t1
MVVKALVIYRRDNVLGSAATVFSTVSRVIGREAENAYWVLHENVPVLVNARKMRPADEIEVAARRILASTGQNSGLQWFADERAADPVTARVTPRPLHYHNAPIELQLGLDQAMSAEWQKYTEFNAELSVELNTAIGAESISLVVMTKVAQTSEALRTTLTNVKDTTLA